MTSFATTLFAGALLLSCVDARMRREEPAAPKYKEEMAKASKTCEELCKVDSGMDADNRDCLTECSVSTDLHTHHLDEGFHHFAQDESYNEKGGEKMKELHNEKAPQEAHGCAPLIDLTKVPQFSDIDTNGDGVIDFEENALWAEKACVPDEMSEQVFSEADLNQDKVIDKSEFKEAGEGTKAEEAMDKALEKVSQGDDEYNSVQNPPLEEFDKNKDGALDNDEAHDVFEHELERRTEHEDVPEETMKELEPKIDDAIDKVDTNDDGQISGDEYVAQGDGSDLGQELKEAATADEDAKELDDLARADGAAAAAPAAASFTQHHRHHHLRKAKHFARARRHHQ